MKIVYPSYEILSITYSPLELIETAGRTCYKSESKGSPEEFTRKIVNSGHESVIEHAVMTVKFIVDRGVSHELVRHRLASYSQESTRYANYSKDKFENEIAIVRPPFFQKPSQLYELCISLVLEAEYTYMRLLENGASPQEARSVLPNSLKTEVVMTANFREWKHVFKLRCSKAAHPQIREVMIPLRDEMIEKYPSIFQEAT